MRELKVYGGNTFIGCKQVRAIIATRTKKAAMEILDMTASYFNDYWCVTGNEIEVPLAMGEPETIFYLPYGRSQEYVKLEKLE